MNTANSKFVILTDSLRTLNCIQQLYPKNNIIKQIRDQLTELSKKQVEIRFIWIPSHMGIIGNDIVDALAKETSNPFYNIQIPTIDIVSIQ